MKVTSLVIFALVGGAASAAPLYRMTTIPKPPPVNGQEVVWYRPAESNTRGDVSVAVGYAKKNGAVGQAAYIYSGGKYVRVHAHPNPENGYAGIGLTNSDRYVVGHYDDNESLQQYAMTVAGDPTHRWYSPSTLIPYTSSAKGTILGRKGFKDLVTGELKNHVHIIVGNEVIRVSDPLAMNTIIGDITNDDKVIATDQFSDGKGNIISTSSYLYSNGVKQPYDWNGTKSHFVGGIIGFNDPLEYAGHYLDMTFNSPRLGVSVSHVDGSLTNYSTPLGTSSNILSFINSGDILVEYEFLHSNEDPYQALLSKGVSYKIKDILEPGSRNVKSFGVTHMSDNGVMVGTAIIDNEIVGILLTPVPEPATIALIGAGLAYCLRKRKLA